MYYNLIGVEVKEWSKLGIWFNIELVIYEVLMRQVGNVFPIDTFGSDIYIVQGEEVKLQRNLEIGQVWCGQILNILLYIDNWKIIGIMLISELIIFYGFFLYMYLRGKSLKWVVTYFDGCEEMIFDVLEFDFNWQIYYELVELFYLFVGSKISGIGVYDNLFGN